MTNKEIQLIIKQAVKEAREETKQEIYQQIKNITDIDPATDEGLHKLRDVFKASEQLGIPLETKRYKKWDLYAAVNMVYSDFYDEDKPDSMYIKDGYRFVSDPDFKRIGKMKIYAASAHKK